MADDNYQDDTQTQGSVSTEQVLDKDKDKKILELEDQLKKLKDKETNFGKLRNKVEETEKQKLETETELEKMKREQDEKIREIREENQKWKEDQFKEQKEEYFKGLCGNDKELRDKLEYEMGQLKGDVNTVPQLREKMEKAYLLVKGARPQASMFGKLATTSGPIRTEKSSFSDTDQGKDVLRKITKGQVDWDKIPKRSSDGSYFNL